MKKIFEEILYWTLVIIFRGMMFLGVGICILIAVQSIIEVLKK